MTTSRKEMEAALRRATARHLRPLGFSGSLPHLRRRSDTRVDLLSVQFHSAGGSFVVEVAACGTNGYTTSWGQHIEPAKVRAQHISSPRPRLGSATFPVGDHWFVFGRRSYESGNDRIEATAHYDTIASEVIRLVHDQAEPFWRKNALPS